MWSMMSTPKHKGLYNANNIILLSELAIVEEAEIDVLTDKNLTDEYSALDCKSLVTLEQDTLQQKLASASSVNNIVNYVANSTEQDDIGRVSGWAVSFDKLLKDTLGNSIFSDFLKKEFSEENVEFWKACEDFKTILDSNNRKSRAKEIYDKHVSSRASEGVNIDSVARRDVKKQLDNPTPQMFNIAQQQIFQLMRQDSYARFLKSECYKTVLMREMEGKPLQHVSESTDDKVKSSDKANEKDGKKKGKENEEKPEKHRFLLPWRQKYKKNSKSDTEEKNSKSDKDSNTEMAAATASTSAVTTATTSAVAMANMGAGTTIDPITQKEVLQVVPLNLSDDISTLASKEITVVQWVIFRMDFPSKKSTLVKVRPNRLIRDVIHPVLNEFGYRMEYTDVRLCGQSNSLCMDNYASALDGQRVVVMMSHNNVPEYKKNSKSDTEEKNSKSDKDSNTEMAAATASTSAVTTATTSAVAMANMGAGTTIDPITQKEVLQVVQDQDHVEISFGGVVKTRPFSTNLEIWPRIDSQSQLSLQKQKLQRHNLLHEPVTFHSACFNPPSLSHEPVIIHPACHNQPSLSHELPETNEKESETPKCCHVIMPDGSTTVVRTRQGQTIHYIFGKLCEKQGLHIACVDMLLPGSDLPLNINDDMSTLASKEVRVEKRVLFRMDLPNKKSIGVKAKPDRLIRDVIHKVLTKHGYRMEYTDVFMYGQSNSLCMDNDTSTLSGQRVVVINSTR